MALRISRAASSRISMDACSLYQAVCGVQIRLGASFRGPWLKLQTVHAVRVWAGVPSPAKPQPPSPSPAGSPDTQTCPGLLTAGGAGQPGALPWPSLALPAAWPAPGSPRTARAPRQAPGLSPDGFLGHGASSCGHTGPWVLCRRGRPGPGLGGRCPGPSPAPLPGRQSQAPEGLGLMHVQGRATDAPLLQRLRQRLLVHQAAPCRVHQEGPLSHL